MEKICCIFAAGEYSSLPDLPENCFIIAADGGEEALLKMNITPDISLGDFDSITFSPRGKEKISFSSRKDDTDTQLAIKEGLKRGFKTFYIYGALGGRLDHAIANLQILGFIAEKGGRGFILDGNRKITAIKDSFKIEKGTPFSLFALSGEVEGLTISGAEYEGEDITLSPLSSLGVSNKAINETVVSLKKGVLHIFLGE